MTITDYKAKQDSCKFKKSDKNSLKLKPLEVIELVKESVSIEEMLDFYFGIDLSAAKGRKTKFICCPFHSEKTPSFAVTPSLNKFQCFGCGCKGDSITLVSLQKNVKQTRAAYIIAEDFKLLGNADQQLKNKISLTVEDKQELQEFFNSERTTFNFLSDFKRMIDEIIKNRIQSEKDMELYGYLYHWSFKINSLMDLLIGAENTSGEQRVDNFFYIQHWIESKAYPMLSSKLERLI